MKVFDMPPSMDPKIVKCVELIFKGDGSNLATTRALEKMRLPNDPSARRNVMKHVQKSRKKRPSEESAQEDAAERAVKAAQEASKAAAAALVHANAAQHAVKNLTTTLRDFGWRRTRKHTHDMLAVEQQKDEELKVASKDVCFTRQALKGGKGVEV